jgi:hypothetical protein
MTVSSKNLLYTLPGFSQGLPKSDVLVDHALSYFFRARENQGMVGLSWEGENKRGAKILYHDLFIAFNKDDELPRSDRFDVKFKEEEMILSDQPIGKNTGIVHEKALTQFKIRIANAIESKHKSLVNFKGLYTLSSTGEIILNKQKMFGWGLFKGDDDFLLRSIRNKSANINNHSIVYNQEYLYLHFFEDEEVDVDFTLEYVIRRCLPLDITKRIRQVLQKQLPLNIIMLELGQGFCRKHMTELNNYPPEKNWKKIQHNPVNKIELLAETLERFCGLEEKDYKRLCALHPGADHIKNVIDLLQKNYEKTTKIQFSLKQVLEYAITDDSRKIPENIVKKIKDRLEDKKQENIPKEKKELASSILVSNHLFNKPVVFSRAAPLENLLSALKTIKEIKDITIQEQKTIACIDNFILHSISFNEIPDYAILTRDKNTNAKNAKIMEKFFNILYCLDVSSVVFNLEMFHNPHFIDDLATIIEKHLFKINLKTTQQMAST